MAMLSQDQVELRTDLRAMHGPGQVLTLGPHDVYRRLISRNNDDGVYVRQLNQAVEKTGICFTTLSRFFCQRL